MEFREFTPIRVCVVSIALSIAFGSVSASMERRSAQDQKASGTTYSAKRMADGKQWMTHNLNVHTVPSYVTQRRNRIAASMAVCTRGSRRGEDVNHWEMDGDCRLTTNGGRWRSTTVASARIRTTRVKSRTRRSWAEAARDSMPCSAAAAPMMASLHDWTPMDSTGRHRRVIPRVDGSTTSV